MSQNSNIQWTDDTFNAWWGCEKVSPACAHCYAETWAKRVGFSDGSKSGNPALWGAGSARRFFGDDHWKEPERWNLHAAKNGVRRKIFCSSMADVFEDRDELIPHRARLFKLINDTPNLDWQLLTKRPESWRKLVESASDWHFDFGCRNIAGRLQDWWKHKIPPKNVWMGTTVEDQPRLDLRVPELVEIPAAVRFLSCEPLLGPLNFSMKTHSFEMVPGIHWIIAGGESGTGARPMHPDWARSLRDQCQAADVRFFFKQWGEWAPKDQLSDEVLKWAAKNRRFCGKFGTPTRFSGMIGEIPGAYVGKDKAGRLLDGREWNEFPK